MKQKFTRVIKCLQYCIPTMSSSHIFAILSFQVFMKFQVKFIYNCQRSNVSINNTIITIQHFSMTVAFFDTCFMNISPGDILSLAITRTVLHLEHALSEYRNEMKCFVGFVLVSLLFSMFCVV